VVLAGQAAANSMGLGFASMVDPSNGVQVPILSTFYLLVSTLIFLAAGGHLLLIQLLAESFRTMPIAADGLTRNDIWTMLSWASVMFAGALLIALPLMTALLLVNLSFGVITRSAPQLNIFAVGFPLSLTLGFVMVWVTLPHLLPQFDDLMLSAFQQLRLLIGVR
jgi:flagellar biosynthetic protein FliR